MLNGYLTNDMEISIYTTFNFYHVKYLNKYKYLYLPLFV